MSRPKVEGRDTGIFTRKERTFNLADKAQLKKFIATQARRLKRDRGAMGDIIILETQLAKLLKKYDYPTRLPELAEHLNDKKKPDIPWPWFVGDAEAALWEFHMLRNAMKSNNIENAVRHALRAAQLGMKAAIGPVEPLALQGRKSRQGAITGGKNRRTSHQIIRRWLELASEFRKKNPSAKPHSVAVYIANKLYNGKKTRTIARVLNSAK